MKADLVSNLLDFADLGPLIGAQPGSVEAARRAAPLPSQAAAPTPVQARVLPDMPFKTDRWDSVDAEVKLTAKTIRHAKELPLEDLVTSLSLRDSVLTLDPLNFGVAGGEISKLMMEKAGLHLWEILELKVAGDKLVKCSVPISPAGG